MSVYIKGMEMPDNCLECPFKIDGDDGGICPYVSNYCADYENDRHKDCPLVPVPEHGDLIDRDALVKSDRMVGKLMMFGGEYVYTQAEIDRAPTIIPADQAEEDEG